jgi:hypothetical protein
VLRDLSSRIDAFAHTGSARPAPPAPGDLAARRRRVERFEEETRRVRAALRREGALAHDLVGIRGVRDRDFDTFYRRPANEFQIRVVAKRLNVLATTLGRRR